MRYEKRDAEIVRMRCGQVDPSGDRRPFLAYKGEGEADT